MVDDKWLETQVIRNDFNLKEVINENFLEEFEKEFENTSAKVFNVDIVLMDEEDLIVDVVSLNHKKPSFESQNKVVVDSNKEPFFINKIKKVIDSFKNK
ncbi:hypothetical protein MBBAR_10c00230 [Methanobrevibacter arboriphilus JCM 13429 = DSM 1125]|uniref:Uncharacterized protein n=1 Tax=Methanobrevibacter arboriphilus JCM 13429 = DSM 1125 TaxID=1300164 RepID=A0A1V6N262_METAZ|nr:hypothetical protein [Methanobrevibacter arboriphilus]OQD58682.1 hypothetical protein MBBAR_10c00230 [Methanobrevibacter arboriphilus JCM 13429 = DSM 1125]